MPPPIDLESRDLEIVRAILADYVPDCEVRAFGSRVGGKAKPFSDLDLALVGASSLTADRIGRLREAFAESDLPIKVDILDWHTISDPFRAIIERRYVVVQKPR